MRRWLSIASIAALASLANCFGLFDSETDHVVDNYEVTWIDEHAHRALYQGSEEIVPAYVAAVGFDTIYLFVKQHPTAGEHDERVLESITNYYLIERDGGVVTNKQHSGPYSEATFNALCKKRGVKKIKFTMQYPENI